MKRLPLFLMIFSLAFVSTAAQTNKPAKTKKTPVQPTKTVTAIKPVTEVKASASLPIPVPTPVLLIPPAQTITLSKFEAEILAELNLFRRNPQSYVKHLEDYLKTYDGEYFRTGEGVRLQSFEGKIPVEEAIAALKQAQPLTEFKLADGLIKAAVDHSQDLIKNNRTGHRGTNGSLPPERVAIYGTAANGLVNENISYMAKNARDVVLTMLVDDGTATRNHRKTLLNQDLKLVGLATGENKAGGLHCILVLVSDFSDKK